MRFPNPPPVELRMYAWAKAGLAVLTTVVAVLPAATAAAGADAPRVPVFARQALPAGDGWASAGTGTTGGSAADSAHVFVVHTRDELAAPWPAARRRSCWSPGASTATP